MTMHCLITAPTTWGVQWSLSLELALHKFVQMYDDICPPTWCQAEEIYCPEHPTPTPLHLLILHSAPNSWQPPTILMSFLIFPSLEYHSLKHMPSNLFRWLLPCSSKVAKALPNAIQTLIILFFFPALIVKHRDMPYIFIQSFTEAFWLLLIMVNFK